MIILLGVIGLVVVVGLLGLHLGFRAPRVAELGSPADAGFAFAQVRIPTRKGKHLFGWLITSPDADATVLVQHGWGGNAELMLPLAAPFARAGFNILLVDARNHGRSDGDGHSSLPKFAEDIAASLDWLKRNHSERARHLILVGHSVGAAAVLLVASRREDIGAVISISAFAHPEWMMQRYLSRWPLPRVAVHTVLRYVEWIIGQRFEAIAPLRTARQASCPVLLVHGTADTTVPFSDAHAIASAAEGRIQVLEVADAEHDSADRIQAHFAPLLHFLDHAGISPPQRR